MYDIGNFFAVSSGCRGGGGLADRESIAPMDWQHQAASNLKLICNDALQDEGIEQIAARLARLYDSARDYNESIRLNADIQPEAKLWL